MIEAYAQGKGICGSCRHTRTVSCVSRDHNRSQNAVQGYSVIRQQDHLSRPEGRQKCNELNTRWSAPSSQRTQGHREPRGGGHK